MSDVSSPSPTGALCWGGTGWGKKTADVPVYTSVFWTRANRQTPKPVLLGSDYKSQTKRAHVRTRKYTGNQRIGSAEHTGNQRIGSTEHIGGKPSYDYFEIKA